MSDQSLLDGVDGSAKLRIEKSRLEPDGLGLTAAVAISAAEDVFSKAQMLNIADNGHLNDICDCCFIWLGDSVNLKTYTLSAEAAIPTLKICSRCHVVRYCSNSCQRAAWKSHHKAECKLFAQVHIEDVVFRATLRLLCMRSLGTLNDNQWHWINRMQSHMEDYRHSEPELRQVISKAASSVFQPTGLGGSEENIRELYFRIRLNHMTDTRMEGETTGITLDPLAALMNHSCNPNVFCVFEGTRIRVRSLRPIEVGEEVTMAYADPTVPLLMRREALSKWFFSCACQKCSKEAIDDSPKLPSGFNMVALMEAAQSMDFSNPEKSDSAIFGTGGPGAGWPASIQPIPSLHFHLATAWRAKTISSNPATSHNEVQLSLLNELRHRLPLCLIADPAIRPNPTHPLRINNLFRLVMLLREIFRDRSAFPGFPFSNHEVGTYYAYNMMLLCRDAKISHGKDSPLAVAVNKSMTRQLGKEGDPAMIWKWTDEELQDLKELQSRLLQWSGSVVDG